MPTPYDELTRRIDALSARTDPPWIQDACGVTRRDTQLASLVHIDAYAAESDRHRVLLLGGLTGARPDVEAALSAMQAYAASQRLRNRVALSAIPCANPDGLNLDAAPGNGSGGVPSTGYPPEDGFFNHDTDPESRYLWRYVGFMAPDCVLEIRAGESVGWESANAPAAIADALNARPLSDDGELLPALASGEPNDLGSIPGLRLIAPPDDIPSEIARLARVLDAAGAPLKSPARTELDARRSRTPAAVAERLVAHYGDTLDPVIYTQGVALSGRLRFGALSGTRPAYADGIAQLVEPYLSGASPWFSDSDGGANYAGIVWADEMFDATGDSRYRDLLLEIAALFMDGEIGRPPPPCDPDYRTEDMFFAGAILGRAHSLTGDVSYMDVQTAFLLNANIQNDDGLFKHCRSVPYYWGRGNGFAALGYAETLTHLPEDHPDRDALVEIHARHLSALRDANGPSGVMSQLLDMPGTYRELTATCMTGYAVARGLRLGWLDGSWREFADSLWRAASERIGSDGEVVDGCTGTGAVNDRRFYIDRAAEFGRDDRTGNLALWFAVEMERLGRDI